MGDRENHFLKFNEEELMTGALEIEQHARNLAAEHALKNASCISKHALLMHGHVNEAISHSAVVAPEKMPFFQDLSMDIDRFRETLSSTRDPKTIIRTIRDIRKKIEKVNPDYALEDCQVCGRGAGSSPTFIKAKNPVFIEGEIPMKAQVETLIKDVAGAVVVAKVADFGVSKVGVLRDNAALSRVGLGVAALYLGKGSGTVKSMLKVGGSFLIAKEAYNYVSGMTAQYGFAAPNVAVRSTVPVMPQSYSRGGSSIF